MSLSYLKGKNEKHRHEWKLKKHIDFVTHTVPTMILPNKISSWASEIENVIYVNIKKNDGLRET